MARMKAQTRPRPVERHLRPMRRAGISTVRSMPTDTRRACIRRQSQAESSTDASASHQIRGGWLHAGKYHNPAQHSQQKPDLLLTTVITAHFAPDEFIRHFVPQPIARASNHADILRL